MLCLWTIKFVNADKEKLRERQMVLGQADLDTSERL